MSREATWYFDPISPYAYLELADFAHLPADLEVRPVPVLLAALLNHWGTKGPAEMPTKRLHTYRQCAWLAKSKRVPFKMPPRHPFNPLSALRLLCALGPSVEQARIACSFVFGEGKDPSTPEGLADLGAALGVRAPETLTSSAAAKDKLRANTEEAAKRGAWGVPTFILDEQIFWGADAFPMFLDYLAHPALFESEEMKRIETLPIGASRQ